MISCAYPCGPARRSSLRIGRAFASRTITLRAASLLQLEVICPVRASGLLPVVHGAALDERDLGILTGEGHGHGIHFMPVRRRLGTLRRNILPDDQAVALAHLLAEPCGSGARAAHSRGFLKLKEL